MSFVLDASVTLAWCFPDERTEHTEELLSSLATSSAAVPVHWPLEVSNSLLVGIRRGRLSSDVARNFAIGLELLSIEHDQRPQHALHVLELAESYRLSSYDAAYLELAQRLKLPLATLDRDLARAARKAGVTLAL